MLNLYPTEKQFKEVIVFITNNNRGAKVYVFVKTIAAAGGVILTSLNSWVLKNAFDNLNYDVFWGKVIDLTSHSNRS
ncbi:MULTISPECIES: hypothetical protein [Bartonella]|uniref:Uncharacterized protein n=1 Tax=Bartonella kosoyi TaxID=2133959 RepID=A0A5B9CXP7_9HYPH|nr:hypothetical protein [Bartonella kosoyi]QEE08917.1 hypothetical protein D1093_04610 [Bartonella kosoyi]